MNCRDQTEQQESGNSHSVDEQKIPNEGRSLGPLRIEVSNVIMERLQDGAQPLTFVVRVDSLCVADRINGVIDAFLPLRVVITVVTEPTVARILLKDIHYRIRSRAEVRGFQKVDEHLIKG